MLSEGHCSLSAPRPAVSVGSSGAAGLRWQRSFARRRRVGAERRVIEMIARTHSPQPATVGPAPHVPVLRRQAIDYLAPRDGGVYIDGTFGAGGYAAAILHAADARVIGIDRDASAIAGGQVQAEAAGGRLTLIEGRFAALDTIASGLGIAAADGVVFDLGVSSMQLDTRERGFSFRHDGPLDMRMGRDGPTAADILAAASERDLADIIFNLGEERHARAVARAIVAARRQRLIVNDELHELEGGLAAAERALKPGGRLVVISFHSLEDRIVKTFLATRSGSGGPSRHLPERTPQAA